MSDYTKTVDFAAKDLLLTGNPSKLIKGTEIGAEFDAIATAVATKIDDDATLASLSALGTAADRYAYTTGIDTWAEGTITAAGRALLDDANAAAQLVTLGAASTTQVQNSTLITLTTVAGTDTITAGAPDPFTAYADGQEFSFIAAGTNTGAATLNIDSVGAIDIKKNGGTALSAGDITSGAFIKVKYVSATGDFEMMGGAGGGGGVALSDNNTWTGTNTFRNAAGIRSEQAATQDAIALVGRAGGTGSYEVTLTPTTLTADRTITVPDASGTMAYTESGTFTGTLTGVTAAVTGTIQYAKVGRIVTLSFPGDSAAVTFTGTSNATSKTITGMPSGLYPIAQFTGHCFGYDNGGAWTVAYFKCSTAGVITIYPTMGGSNWTASGSCGSVLSSISYVSAA